MAKWLRTKGWSRDRSNPIRLKTRAINYPKRAGVERTSNPATVHSVHDNSKSMSVKIAIYSDHDIDELEQRVNEFLADDDIAVITIRYIMSEYQIHSVLIQYEDGTEFQKRNPV